METEEKTEAWTCENCHQPTELKLVTVSLRLGTKRFRSACCMSTVTPTKRPR